MAADDRVEALGEAIRRHVAAVSKDFEQAAPRIQEADARTEPQLNEIATGLREAGELADAADRDGGDAAADLAIEKLTVAVHQLAAVMGLVGETLDRKLPDLPYHHAAGEVSQRREAVADDGRALVASPEFTDDTPHYFPGGTVAGRPIPAGWYSHPWWRDIQLVGGAGAVAGGLTLGALAHEFYDKVIAGMSGAPSQQEWLQGMGATVRVSSHWWPFGADSGFDLPI